MDKIYCKVEQETLLNLSLGFCPKGFVPLEGVFLKCALIKASSFHMRVWKALYSLKEFEIVCYEDIAKKIGSPKACRAVGSAIGKNPLPILIPCHLVICKNGSLGGFAFGLEWKKKLLSGFSMPKELENLPINWEVLSASSNNLLHNHK